MKPLFGGARPRGLWGRHAVQALTHAELSSALVRKPNRLLPREAYAVRSPATVLVRGRAGAGPSLEASLASRD
jgi:hypothetical protein